MPRLITCRELTELAVALAALCLSLWALAYAIGGAYALWWLRRVPPELLVLAGGG